MKLTDNRFIVIKQATHNDRLSEADKATLRLALNSDLSAEVVFDEIVAQAGGPDMNQQDDIPTAQYSDVHDISDQWPEEDIIRQVQDLKQQGMAYGPMLQQLIQMGVLGTDRPFSSEVEYLDSLIKRAYKTAQAGDGGPADPALEIKKTKNRPSELVPGESLTFKDDKSQFHKFIMEQDSNGKAYLTHNISREPELFPVGKAEEVKPSAADMITKRMTIIESNVGGEVKNFMKTKKEEPKAVEPSPKSTENIPGPSIELDFDGKNMLESEKRATLLSFLDHVKNVHQEYIALAAQLSQAIHSRPRGLSPEKQKLILEEINSQPPSERQKVLEKYEYPRRQDAYTRMQDIQEKLKTVVNEQEKRELLQALDKAKADINYKVPFYSPGKGSGTTERRNLQRQVDAIKAKISKLGNVYKKLLSALGYIVKDPVTGKNTVVKEFPKNPDVEWLNEAVDKDWDVLMSKISRVAAYGSGIGTGNFEVMVSHESGQPAAATELSGLLKSLGASGIVEQVSDGKFRVDLPEELEHKLIAEGHFKVHLDKYILESAGEKTSAGDNPAGTAAQPMDGQRNTISAPEIDSTGKIGQAMPPQDPTQQLPPMDQAMPGEETVPAPEVDDPRSMTELLEEIKSDLDALSSKVEGGDAMMGDKELEPITTDSGAVPAPGPGKVAVDDQAKDYYSDYYGDFGDDMTRDRVADIVESIDKVALHYGVNLSNDSVNKLTDFIASSVSGDSFYNDVVSLSAANESLAKTADTVLINYIIKTGIDLASLNNDIKPSIFAMALNDSKAFGKLSALINAQKMKTPSVKKSPDDQVDVDEIGDNANNESLPTQHLCVTVEDQSVNGQYTYLDLSWDSDDVRLRSSGDVKQLLNSFIKGLESKKEFKDFGILGKVRFEEFDPEAGVATVYFKSSRPADSLKVVKTE